MNKLIEYIKINNLGEYYTNKTFKDVTTLKIGGKIKLLFYPNTIENFIKFYKFYLMDKKYHLTVIGNGSNVFANSKDYDGVVICFKKIKFKYSIIKNIVTVNSGVMIMDLINYCKNKKIGGLEKLSYIPATIGGMIKMNAGAYNYEISNQLLYITVIDKNGNIRVYNKKDIIFSYRKCNIEIDDIILNCTFELNSKPKEEINKTMEYIKNNRKNKQPIEFYNAGSTFKNINDIHIWKLIDSLGLRGYRINDAMISEKHCNFLINKKDCNSDDMIDLINFVKSKIKEKYNISIECEWNFINF